MCRRRDCPPRRLERVLEHVVRRARALRMVGEPRKLLASFERTHHRRVKRAATMWRQVALDREPRELVAEGGGVAVGAEHSCSEACLEARELCAPDGLEQR